MKDWLIEYKKYLFAAVLVVIGGIYYVYIYDVPSTNPTAEKIDHNLKTDAGTKEAGNKKVEPEKIIVDVKGQVKLPGVYQSSVGERVIDVITRAGGLTENADERGVNFAEHVQDEMVVYIPAKGDEGQTVVEPVGGSIPSPGGSSSNNQGKIDLNKADVNELQTLPGIGPAKAAAIVEYRGKSGKFKAIEDLKNISGIGDKTFEKLKDLIAVH
jgi:competence protein ComEA